MIFEHKPKIAIVGYGRAGKDTAGYFLSTITALRYTGSMSNVVCPLIAKEKGISAEEAWSKRHAERDYWKNWCDEYRKDDPTKIIRACLDVADIVVGVRGDLELYTAQASGLIHTTVWIGNPRVKVDPTVDFVEEDCDLTIYNDGDYAKFYRRLTNFARFAGLCR